MNKTHRNICALMTLTFAVATVLLFISREMSAIWMALLPPALQLATFALIREKNMISYALTFVPSSLLSIHLSKQTSGWFCLLTLIAVVALCWKKWPESRSTTHNWTGACAVMVVIAHVAALYLTA